MITKKSLTLKKSGIASKGQVRLNSQTLKELEIDRGDKVEISLDGKMVTLRPETSKHIDKKEVGLNEADIKQLGAEAGDKVTVKKAG